MANLMLTDISGDIPDKYKDYKVMKPYIDIAEKVKAEQMAIFEKNLKG